MLIAGDIGATKTLLALYTEERGPRCPLVEREFPSEAFAGLADIVRVFLSDVGQEVTAGCFDVAGPVVGGRAELTNLPWLIEEETLARELGLARVSIINDLMAVAYAVPHLQENELWAINPGKAEPHCPIAILAPGTGLGEAFLIRNGSKHIACASEGGHADFAPVDSLQAALLEHLARTFGHVSYERVCSGSAIPGLYAFLRAREPTAESAEFARRLAAAKDRTRLIVAAALEDSAKNPLAPATLDLFVSVLGAEGGNLVLKVLATGGLYLAGGMPERILPRLEDGRFMRAFTAKGRFAGFLRDVPVKVVVTKAALLGAACYGLERLRAAKPSSPQPSPSRC